MSADMSTKGEPIWHPVCTVGEIPRRGARTLRAGGSVVALFRLSDDRILAVDNRCPHKQGPLAEGMVSGDSVICPLHARKIDLTSGRVLAPDSGCVQTYAVRIENGVVLIQLGTL